MSYQDAAADKGVRNVTLGILINIALSLVKFISGVVGNSYALIADAIESLTDVFTSIIVLCGLRISRKPPDDNHPYGHGKFEPLAGAVVALGIIGAAIFIAVESIHEIRTPHQIPKPFTLLVLIGTVFLKEWLSRKVTKVGSDIQSSAIKAEGWHHRSDAITSATAFVGISIAIFGGPGWEMSDDIAALFASAIISFNGAALLRSALHELMDAAPDQSIKDSIIEIALSVPGVKGTHKCQVRKLGFDYFVDLDILCDPNATIRFGHDLAHDVGEAIHKKLPQITKVLVHVEPEDDFGRRSRS